MNNRCSKLHFYSFIGILLCFPVLIISCSGNSVKEVVSASDQNLNKEQEAIEDAVEYGGSNKLDLGSYSSRSSYSDKVNDLFEHHLKKNDQLRVLVEEQQDLFNQSYKFSTEQWKSIKKSTEYYHSAEEHLSYIRDTTLAKKIKDKLWAHEEAYYGQVRSYEQKDSILNAEKAKISDALEAIKILKTLELMEEYQSTHQPNEAGTEEWTLRMKELGKKVEGEIGK